MNRFRSSTLITAAAVAVAVIVGPAAGQAAATSTPGAGKKVLIYGATLDSGETFNELTAAQQQGFTVTVANALSWATMTAGDFASYNGIIFPCSYSSSSYAAALANAPLWAAAVAKGPKAVNGTHTVSHTDAGAEQLVRNEIVFAASGPHPGVAFDVGCSRSGVTPVLQAAFPGFVLRGRSGDNAKIVDPTNLLMANETNATMSNWGQTWHTEITTYPAAFKPVMVDASSKVAIIVADPGAPAFEPLPAGLLGSPLPADVFAVLRAAFSPY